LDLRGRIGDIRSCSPDFAAHDFWLFPKIKSALKGRIFQDTGDIQKKCDDSTESYLTAGIPKISPTKATSLV
jgi:hypothetical protein